MATRVAVRLNIAGINAVMRSAGAQAAVDAAGREIAARAGTDFEYVHPAHEDHPGDHPWTARGYVQARTARGMRAEARDKVLTRAVGGV